MSHKETSNDDPNLRSGGISLPRKPFASLIMKHNTLYNFVNLYFLNAVILFDKSPRVLEDLLFNCKKNNDGLLIFCFPRYDALATVLLLGSLLIAAAKLREWCEIKISWSQMSDIRSKRLPIYDLL